jgi:hypothetical protein
MQDQANDKRSPIIAGALVLTAAFLTTLGWFLSRTDTCPEGWWLWDRLVCLEPSALGDTFAGAFAPVAFVWLVAAVILQRNELAAQRQELGLTREEFKQTRGEVKAQREAMQAQAEEARKNVEYIGKQTEILDANLRRDMEAAADVSADQLCQSIFVFLNQKVSKGVRQITEYNSIQCFRPIESSDLYIDLRTISEHFDSFILRIHRDKIKVSIDDSVSDALNMIHTLSLALENCSAAKRTIISSANISDTERALIFLFKDKWKEDFRPD